MGTAKNYLQYGVGHSFLSNALLASQRCHQVIRSTETSETHVYELTFPHEA